MFNNDYKKECLKILGAVSSFDRREKPETNRSSKMSKTSTTHDDC